MATEQVATVPQKGFMDFPPEMRTMNNHTIISDTWDNPMITTEKIDCSSIFGLVLTLGLHKRFPLLLTSKQVMYEALASCLEKCTLRLENLDQLDAIRAVRHTSTFQQLSVNIHSLTLDISWYGHGIDNVRDYHPAELNQIKILIPLSGLHARCSCHRFDPSKYNSFAELLAELALLFPNNSSLKLDLDQTTISMHNKLRDDVLAMPWPTLREVKFQRPDLERRFAKSTEQMVLLSRRTRHQAAVWPPQSVPWQLEMDCWFLEVVNENLKTDMHRKVEKGGADARHPLRRGPLGIGLL
jgi:hypothetical protein